MNITRRRCNLVGPMLAPFLNGFADELVKIADISSMIAKAQDQDLLARRDALLAGRQQARAEDRDLLRRRDELLAGRGKPPQDDLIARRDALLGGRRKQPAAPVVAQAPKPPKSRFDFGASQRAFERSQPQRVTLSAPAQQNILPRQPKPPMFAAGKMLKPQT